MPLVAPRPSRPSLNVYSTYVFKLGREMVDRPWGQLAGEKAAHGGGCYVNLNTYGIQRFSRILRGGGGLHTKMSRRKRLATLATLARISRPRGARSWRVRGDQVSGVSQTA